MGNDVVATGSGPINTAGLGLLGNFGNYRPVLQPSSSRLSLGLTAGSPIDGYSGLSGPANYGTGSVQTDASSGTGDRVVLVNPGVLGLSPGYVSGTTLSTTSTWSNKTFATLGITPGIYTWSWGSGPTADTFTINAATAVPEPSSFILGGLVLLGVGFISRRRKNLAGVNVATTAT